MNRCTADCGFCGRCTAFWEEDDHDVEDAPEDLEELRMAEQNEEIYESAVRSWFRRTEPVR